MISFQFQIQTNALMVMYYINRIFTRVNSQYLLYVHIIIQPDNINIRVFEY